jgi:hypothetical protein
MKLRNPGDILHMRIAEDFTVNNLTAKLVDGFSSLRATLIVCLTLIAAGVSSYLGVLVLGDPRNSRKLPNDLLKLVNVEQTADSLPIGSHLVSPRKFYIHHGIYLGGGNVAHYSGFNSSFKPGPIEVTDLESFANGRPLWMYQEQCEYSSNEIVNRACSRLGESQYKILSNNCEHFCSWCVSGRSYSAQVNACFHCPRYLFSFIMALEPNFIA